MMSIRSPPPTFSPTSPYSQSSARPVNNWGGQQASGWETRPYHPPQSAPYPKSSYPMSGAPSALAAFGNDRVGVVGRDPPREIVRIERDFTSGDIAQFHTNYPLELEGRVSASQFQDLINDINAVLLEANSFPNAVVDNVLMVVTFHLSLLVKKSHFEKQLDRLDRLLESKNAEVWNPAGLNVLNPRKKAYLFLEIEYY